MSTQETKLKPPQKPMLEQIVSDLSSVEINENDPLFDGTNGEEIKQMSKNDEDSANYDRLEKFVLFKLNLETAENFEKNNNSSNLSLEYLKSDIELLDKHIGSLKNFIDISKKFLTINKMNK